MDFKFRQIDKYMKKIICYLRTLKDWRLVLQVFLDFNASYIAHDYIEQKQKIKGNRIYYPLKCKTCGNVSTAFRAL